MRHQGPRKSTPKVTAGKVRKKNSWTLSPDYFDAPVPRMVIIDRRRPRPGYKQFLSTSDIYQFLELLPDWNELAVGLNAIVLAAGSKWYFGYHQPGVVQIFAWPSDLWIELGGEYYERDKDILDLMGVERERIGEGVYLCKFDEWSVKAFQLTRVLLHELGHHHDRMTSRRQARCGRGEPYAEEYAVRYGAEIWDAYVRTFKL